MFLLPVCGCGITGGETTTTTTPTTSTTTTTQPTTNNYVLNRSWTIDGDLNRIAVDISGNVYVTDSQAGNMKVWKYSAVGAFLDDWGVPGSGDGEFNIPAGIVINLSDEAYVSDQHRVQKFSSSAIFMGKAGSSVSGTGEGQFATPLGVAAGPGGEIFVADTSNSRVQLFTPALGFIYQWATIDPAKGATFKPQDIAVDSSGNVYVTSNLGEVHKFSSSGVYIAKFSSRTAGNNAGLCVDSGGYVYAANSNLGYRVDKFSPGGTLLTEIGSVEMDSTDGVMDAAVDSDGNVYVINNDGGIYQIRKFVPF